MLWRSVDLMLKIDGKELEAGKVERAEVKNLAGFRKLTVEIVQRLAK